MSGSKAREAAARAIRATPCQNGDTIGTALYCSPILDVDISELDDVCRTIANTAIDAYIAALGETHAIVPREPTEAMLFGSREAWTSPLAQLIVAADMEADAASVERQGRNVWIAMLNAAEQQRRER